MLIRFKQISILLISLLFLSTVTSAQNDKNPKKKIRNINSKSSLPIPHSPDPDQIETLEDKRKDLLDYFVNQKLSIKYFTFNNEKEKIHLDSLLPKFQEYIDAFVQSGKWKTSEDSEYLKNYRTDNIYEQIKIESDKDFNNRTNQNLKKILDSITKMPASKEKVWLTLQYDEL